MFKIKGRLYDFSNPQIMGILNFTPDSFNAASRVGNEEIKDRIAKMLADGADIVDIGGVSTRPGSTPVSEAEEWERLRPALETIAKHFPNAVFSVDTFRSEIARRAVVDYGVSIVNDITAGMGDSKMYETVARCKVPYIIMHGADNPQKLHSIDEPMDIEKIINFFAEKVNTLHSFGISDIVIDPGFGFSKTVAENYELFANLERFRIFGCPLLLGISRKSMIYKYLDISVERSLNATTALNALALAKGASILRVHDVLEAVECAKVYEAAWQNNAK